MCVEVVVCELYVLLLVVGVLFLVIDLQIVELVKVFVNVFLVIKILFINVIFEVCEVVGVDVSQLVDVFGYDLWIGC